MLLQLYWVILFVLMAGPACGSEVDGKEVFAVDDYFTIERFTELAISSDGELIAYISETPKLEENAKVRRIYISSTAPGATPVLIDDIQDARKIAWIPGKHTLGFLSTRQGASQTFSYDVSGSDIRQETNSSDPVTRFRFSPDGQSIAYLSSKTKQEKVSLYDQLQTGDAGVLVDSDIVWAQQFLDPNTTFLRTGPTTTVLWLAAVDGRPLRARIPGKPTEFYWSSNSNYLSVTYAADDMPVGYRSSDKTSIGILDAQNMTFDVLAAADIDEESNGKRYYYRGGEWVPNSEKLLLRRIIASGSWISRHYPAWTIVKAAETDSVRESPKPWQPIETYSSTFIPVRDGLIYVNNTVQGKQSLYQIPREHDGDAVAGFVRSISGSNSLFQFSENFEVAAFVNESMIKAPEIYVWRKNNGVHQLTSFHADVTKYSLPKARAVAWKSSDGVTVHGWLLESNSAGNQKKLGPLITFVHGGPVSVVKDGFADYFDSWPYPLEVCALHGMAIFIPNYRGTGSFGKKFSSPGWIDGEPIEDIITGINYLIDEGIADPDRLGIIGHSHGGWLGPMAMTRSDIDFKAASFAESWSNMITVVSTAPGLLHWNVHVPAFGDSLYENPERYLDLSPDVHFDGLDTPVLFEAGSRSLAINMLGFPKAARYAGMPTEFIIYPQTGHNPTIPTIQHESAGRNLDWFRFWLQGYEDPNLEKREQYARWRKMRDGQCERLKSEDTPSYCRQ